MRSARLLVVVSVVLGFLEKNFCRFLSIDTGLPLDRAFAILTKWFSLTRHAARRTKAGIPLAAAQRGCENCARDASRRSFGGRKDYGFGR
jgi:hypothetical protein